MRKLFLILVALSVSVLSEATSLKERLESLPSVKKVETLESVMFPEKYLLYFEQPIDHRNPSLGTFSQRVFVCSASIDSATVLVTEGYGASYAASRSYSHELSRLFNLNNIIVEHRYFLESTPVDKDWKYLTAQNEANDLHRIVTELKTIFGNKWISTGSSKGGQNTVIYRSFFPDDVDFSVPYVGPFCKNVVDGRHEPFIANVCGTQADRTRVKNIQIEFLKRRDRLMPMMDSLVTANGYQFNIPLDEVYDYTALEFSFSFWQRGHRPDMIPGADASDRELFEYFMGVSGPDYWVKESDTTPFFVMAAKELGYYGYDLKPFKDYLHIKSAKGYLQKIWIPESAGRIRFDRSLSRHLRKFIRKTDSKMLFVYGEYDPWSAVRAGDKHKDNVHIIIFPEGSHSSNISRLPEDMRTEVMAILNDWLHK